MPRHRLHPSSAAGNSLVGTLLALGLLLAMVTGGIALMVSTQGRILPVAEVRLGAIAFEPCPARVTEATVNATTLRCAGVPVLNTGQAEGLARCMLFDGARGTATFDTNGTHVGSIEVAPGATEQLLVRIEGQQNPTLPVAECSSVPLLTH